MQAGGISAEEAAALRREVEATDALLRGYQTENEAATRRIKASAAPRTLQLSAAAAARAPMLSRAAARLGAASVASSKRGFVTRVGGLLARLQRAQ